MSTLLDEIIEAPRQHEIIYDPDDTRMHVARSTSVPFRWICSIDLTFDNPDDASRPLTFRGSGVLIGPSHVLTAAHALYDRIEGSNKSRSANQRVKSVVVTPARNGPTSKPFGSAAGKTYHFPDEWKASVDRGRPDREYDYGLIRLDSPIAAKKFPSLGNKPLGCWGDKANGMGTIIVPLIDPPSKLKGKLINVAGYPGDKCNTKPAKGSATEAQLRACPKDEIGVTLWCSAGTLTLPERPGSKHLMHYTNDTHGGMSGGPVWFRSGASRWLIGIHTSPIHDGDTGKPVANQGLRITPNVWKQIRGWM